MDKWRGHAACARFDVRLADPLFRGKPERWTPEDLDLAREVCNHCPVQWECLSYVLSVPACHDKSGIYAGLRPEDRATLRDGQGPRVRYPNDPYVGGDPHGARLKRLHRSGR